MRKTIRIILLVVLLGVFGYSLYNVIHIQKGYRDAKKTYDAAVQSYAVPLPPPTEQKTAAPADTDTEDAPTEAPPTYVPLQVDFAALTAQAPAVCGWLYCPDTVINYPVVQSSDNNFYLDHAYDGSYSVCGALFTDMRNAADFADHNTVIYGHHMNDGSMFAGLDAWMDQSYYEAHPTMYLLTPERNYSLVLYAGFTTTAGGESYAIYPQDSEGYEEYVASALAQSDFRAHVTPGAEERTVVLSTCAYDFEGARYVLYGILHPLADADLPTVLS